MTPDGPPDLDALPPLPRNGDSPVFAAPWEAQAFAMTLSLHAAGAFTWPEWVAVFSHEIARAPADEDYYLTWLRALEGLVDAKGLAGADAQARRKAAWAAAAASTPHGQPIVLPETP